ncbi:fascin domain-containing protein [Sinomicrobium soli]|uniref:fascin domain-containing protein n=1 Tax=Sinomicrobium sp. N-1-3-6 TaxID=2219864 RepID=UPI000DCC55EF|nr:RICIN domain-containing protein [Sinomicrobium sp. N-1-3-6]RAV28110.1 hypothetical protein DN748_15535 [Sinomicrobium sp. N-1-3-6]
MKTSLFIKITVSFTTGIFIACSGSDLNETEKTSPIGDENVDLSLKDSFLISSMQVVQKITDWGHDIKQDGNAENLTEEACTQIFENGRFNILRIPFYSNAHNPDGSVRDNYKTGLMPLNTSSGEVQWDTISTEGNWFYIENKTFNKRARGIIYTTGQSILEIDTTSYMDNWNQWKLVDAGNGWYHIENRGHSGKHLRADNNGNITLTDNTSTGSWTQWKFTDAGNGYFYIANNGQNKYLSGGGNEYDKIIDVINIAKVNGDPDLYASHKIHDHADHSTERNINFGSFYTPNGIDTDGFAASIDAFLDYIQTHTGKTVKYLAPRCELAQHWERAEFIDIVNKLTHSPLIVSPEMSLAGNSDVFWNNDAEQVTDIKATHNKKLTAPWPANSEYDWDGETIGGNQDTFINLVYKLHEAFYKGKVTGIIFWGQTHLNNTDDDNNNGPFRRELVSASAYNLVNCSVAEDPDSAVIAFTTEDPDKVKVFYASTETIHLRFDRDIDNTSVPAEASGITTKGFDIPATGKSDYGSFIIAFE